MGGIVTNFPSLPFISFPSNVPMNDPTRRDQIIRYLDLAAYHYLNHLNKIKEFYFILIIDIEKPPWILTRYRNNTNLIKGLTNPGFFKPSLDIENVLSRGIGWLSWGQLRKILKSTKGHFRTSASDPFYPCQIPSSYIFSYVPQFH